MSDAPKKKKATRAYAMAMQCHDCLGRYEDGKVDCENVRCPLYTWMPYRKKEPSLDWTEFNPKKKGRVTWEESAREMTDEQREAAAARLRKMRDRKKNGAEDD